LTVSACNVPFSTLKTVSAMGDGETGTCTVVVSCCGDEEPPQPEASATSARSRARLLIAVKFGRVAR